MSSRIIHGSSKTYTHSVGLSCCFRQWRAESHCNQLHGYAIKVHIEFEANRLDNKNWCVDFGDMKEVKQWLEATFDHKLLVARDDPMQDELRRLEEKGLATLVWLEAVGCEAFSSHIFQFVTRWLINHGYHPRVHLKEVRVSEHDGNSAFTRREQW